MHYSRKNPPGKPLKPELFGAAFLQLDQVIERFHPLLEDDHFLQESLDSICEELKAHAVEHGLIESEQGQRVIEHLEQVSKHAQDMAREEQRIIEESHQQAAGQEERDSAIYFDLANELRLCSTQFRRNLMQAA